MNQTVTITASYGGGSAQASLTVAGGPSQFSYIYISPALYSTDNGGGYLSIAAAGSASPGGEIYGELFPTAALPASVKTFDAFFDSVSVTGQTYTLSTVQQGSYMLTLSASIYAITAG